MLSWDEHVRNGTIRKDAPNTGKIIALIKIADARINTMSKIKADKNNSSIIFTNYYDSLREICEAAASLKGYKIYLHEAIGLFLKNILNEEAIYSKFDRYRIMRNRVNYYGNLIPIEETLEAIKEINQIIEKLKTKYLAEFLR